MQGNVQDPSDILLVDDDPVIRLTIGEGTGDTRFRIRTAGTGQECIDACEHGHFDLAIIDQELPDTSGLDLARTLKQRFAIPFLFLTGSDDPAVINEAARLGALGYLVKPVTPRQVCAQLEATLLRSKEISNLGKAIEVSGIVSVAVGLVMHAQMISRDDALLQLRAICRPRNQSLRALSEQLVAEHEIYTRKRNRADLEPETVSLLDIKE